MEYTRRVKEKYAKISQKIPRRLVLFIFGPILFPWSVPLLPVLGFSFSEVFFISLVSQIILWYIPISFVTYTISNILGENYWEYGVVALFLGVLLLLSKRRWLFR